MRILVSGTLPNRLPSYLTSVPVVYENVGGEDRHLIYPSVILACLAVVVIIPIYVFYWKGPQIRMRSPFAQKLEQGRRATMERRRSSMAALGQGRKELNEKGTEKV